MNLQKIIIIGDAGRGKTTLAKKMSDKLQIPHYSTDDFYYEIKYSKPREKNEAIFKSSTIYKKNSWIVEGTTQWLLIEGMILADKIIYLRYKNIFQQWYIILKRYFSKREGSLIQTLSLMKHVFYKRYGLGYKKGKLTHYQVIEPYKEKVIILDTFKKIDDFIESISVF